MRVALQQVLDGAEASVGRHLAFLAELEQERQEGVTALQIDLDAARAVAEAEIVLEHAGARREAEAVLAAARDQAQELEQRAAAEAERTLEWARAQASTLLARARANAARLFEARRADAEPAREPWPETEVELDAGPVPPRPSWWYEEDERPV